MKAPRALVFLVLAACGGSTGGKAGAGGPRPTAVAAAPVERGDVAVVSAYPGELVADAADLAPAVGGRLETVAVRIGDAVQPGQVLARVDDDALRQSLAEARAQLQVAEAGLQRTRTEAELAARELDRVAPLAERDLVSAQELDARRAGAESLAAEVTVAEARLAEAAARVARLEQQVADSRVVSPYDGQVADRYLDPGTVVQAGTPVVRVVAGGPLRVRFRVPEQDLVGLAAGLPLSVTAGGNDEPVPGTVERLAGAVSPEDRAVAVEGVVEDAPWLRPGMSARVRVEREVVAGALVVPGAAVVDRTVGAEVVQGAFTAEGTTARWVPLEVRGRSGDRVAVAGALEPGQPVLVLGHERLEDGAAIQVQQVGP